MSDEAPPLSDLDPDECDIQLWNPNEIIVQYDGWEYFLGEANGPCRPSIDLDRHPIRFYNSGRRDYAIVNIHQNDGEGGYDEWEVKFTVRTVDPIEEVEKRLEEQGESR